MDMVDINAYVIFINKVKIVLFYLSLGDVTVVAANPFGIVTMSESTRKMLAFFIMGGLWHNAFF